MGPVSTLMTTANRALLCDLKHLTLLCWFTLLPFVLVVLAVLVLVVLVDPAGRHGPILTTTQGLILLVSGCVFAPHPTGLNTLPFLAERLCCSPSFLLRSMKENSA